MTNISSAEPQTGFRIAFNMFDTDGNERVDKEEFLVVSVHGTVMTSLTHSSGEARLCRVMKFSILAVSVRVL